MFGWRGRIGYLSPGISIFWSEFARVLPEGVACALLSLGVKNLAQEEFERVSKLYFDSAMQLVEADEVNFITLGAPPVFAYMGYDKAEELARKIEKTTGVPTMLYDQTIYHALHKLSAKKLVLVGPWKEELMERTTKMSLEKAGFEILNVKGLGLRTNMEAARQPPYAPYRLAKQAFEEARDAEAIFIQCPAWRVVETIETLEKDVGKPVVSVITAVVSAGLAAMNIREPVKGYGRLLEIT